MKERPILFSGAMVRAILNGRKTQTRRVLKGLALSWLDEFMFTPEFVADPDNAMCPFGVPGDRLWVRETWLQEYDPITVKSYFPPRALYKATESRHCVQFDGDGFAEINKDGTEKSPWRPSIFMPRWASRITLEITKVRVERLQEISEEDCLAEGCPDALGSEYCIDGMSCRKAWYADLWDSINGKNHPWASNPWVWVIEFQRKEAT